MDDLYDGWLPLPLALMRKDRYRSMIRHLHAPTPRIHAPHPYMPYTHYTFCLIRILSAFNPHYPFSHTPITLSLILFHFTIRYNGYTIRCADKVGFPVRVPRCISSSMFMFIGVGNARARYNLPNWILIEMDKLFLQLLHIRPFKTCPHSPRKDQYALPHFHIQSALTNSPASPHHSAAPINAVSLH